MGTLRRVFSKKNKALLVELVKTDFKLRYQGSAIGYVWSLLRPLLMFVILYVVFVVVFPLGKGIPHYPVYLFTGLITWNFFTEMTQQSLGSIVGRGDLIRKIRIPRWMIVFSTSLNALINLGLNLVVLTVFMAINHVSPMATLWFFPLILFEVYILAIGLSFFLSAAYVKYRDVLYIWEVIVQAGIYVTPILYPLAQIKNVLYEKIMLMNPLAQAVQDARYAVVTHNDNVVTIWRIFDNKWYALIPFALVLIVFVAGLAYFRNQQNSFAENL